MSELSGQEETEANLNVSKFWTMTILSDLAWIVHWMCCHCRYDPFGGCTGLVREEEGQTIHSSSPTRSRGCEESGGFPPVDSSRMNVRLVWPAKEMRELKKCKVADHLSAVVCDIEHLSGHWHI